MFADCASSLLTSGFHLDAPTQSSPFQARSLDDDDEGFGDDDDSLACRAADEELKMEEVSDRVFFRREMQHFSRSSGLSWS